MDMFNMEDGHTSLVEGVGRVQCPVLVLGVTSDVLFPVEQQREMVSLLKEAGYVLHYCTTCYWLLYCARIGNDKVTYYELSSIYGHDTFLLDVNNLGVAVKVRFATSWSACILIGCGFTPTGIPGVRVSTLKTFITISAVWLEVNQIVVWFCECVWRVVFVQLCQYFQPKYPWCVAQSSQWPLCVERERVCVYWSHACYKPTCVFCPTRDDNVCILFGL